MTDCQSVIRIFDERWGTFVDYCHLPEGHEGDHRSPRTACEPPGYFGWSDEQIDGGESGA